MLHAAMGVIERHGRFGAERRRSVRFARDDGPGVCNGVSVAARIIMLYRSASHHMRGQGGPAGTPRKGVEVQARAPRIASITAVRTGS